MEIVLTFHWRINSGSPCLASGKAERYRTGKIATIFDVTDNLKY
jgi:hypothetical protein